MKKPSSFTLAVSTFFMVHSSCSFLELLILVRFNWNHSLASSKTMSESVSSLSNCRLQLSWPVLCRNHRDNHVDNVNKSGPLTEPWGLCSIFHSCEAAPIAENNFCLMERYDSRECRTFPPIPTYLHYIFKLLRVIWSKHQVAYLATRFAPVEAVMASYSCFDVYNLMEHFYN